MIKIETHKGIMRLFLSAYLIVGDIKIDLTEGSPWTEEEAGKAADELQACVDEIRLFADRNK